MALLLHRLTPLSFFLSPPPIPTPSIPALRHLSSSSFAILHLSHFSCICLNSVLLAICRRRCEKCRRSVAERRNLPHHSRVRAHTPLLLHYIVLLLIRSSVHTCVFLYLRSSPSSLNCAHTSPSQYASGAIAEKYTPDTYFS